jgi:hypothetical protein
MTEKEHPASADFFTTLRGSVVTSIPALSALVFVIVAVKVFRVSGMETTTTVAIVSTADTVALLKGVTLTMLPGFLTGVTAAAMWWWADALPETADGSQGARVVLTSPQSAFALAMLATSFFTVSWPIFVALAFPCGYVVWVLERRGSRYDAEMRGRLQRVLKGFGGVVATVAVGTLTLAPMVWLPLRTITVAEGAVVTANGKAMPGQFAAYVMNADDKSVDLLLAKPRVVISVEPAAVTANRPLCVTPEAPTRVFYLRASQLLGIDDDDHSPYPECPDLDYQTIFGN